MKTETDLFGQAIAPRADSPPLANGVRKRKPTKPNGYAATPGSGPKGETCKTCQHYGGHQRNRTFRKCELMRAHWTHGPGSDIKAGSPACSRFKKAPPKCTECKGYGFFIVREGTSDAVKDCPRCQRTGIEPTKEES